MAVTAFGLGTPLNTLTAPGTPWGLSPYSGVGISPFMSIGSQYPLQTQLPQVLQLLHVVPQQLQQILQLGYLQQQQLQQLQHTLQFIPAQLQQLIQFAPQYLQHQQMQQPFGAPSVFGSPWGISPQLAGAQPSQVM